LYLSPSFQTLFVALLIKISLQKMLIVGLHN
jgi:hypothetical protein